MTQTFRNKAQKFAEQLVSEVFAAREGSEPIEPAGEPPALPEELRALSSSAESVTAMIPPRNASPASISKLSKASTPNEPQAYRDESRVSEYGKLKIWHLLLIYNALSIL